MAAGVSRLSLLDTVPRSLDVSVIRPLTGGGSGAYSALARDRQGRLVVLKVLAQASNVVDGHDLNAFRAKQLQVGLLQDLAPAIAARYPQVHQVGHEDTWSAYVYEHIPRPNLVEVATNAGVDRAHRALCAIWRQLAADGYSVSATRASSDHWQRVYLDRVPRRRWILEANVPQRLLTADQVRVNGRVVRGLDATVAAASAITKLLATATLAPPVHGDLNLRNLLLADPAPAASRSAAASRPAASSAAPDFTLIDPRGTLDLWDPCYDLAKLLFTLSLFEAAMASGFHVRRHGPVEYTVTLRSNPLRQWLSRFVADARSLSEVIGLNAAAWRAQLLFAHAAHVLSEASCRLSDRSEPKAVRLNRCLGLLLYGLLLLGDLLDQVTRLDVVDVRRHLALVEPGASPDANA